MDNEYKYIETNYNCGINYIFYQPIFKKFSPFHLSTMLEDSECLKPSKIS